MTDEPLAMETIVDSLAGQLRNAIYRGRWLFGMLAWSVLPTLLAEDLSSRDDDKLRADVAFLADDALQGRGVGTPGIEQAAEYIAQSFQHSGLRVDLFDGKPFQSVSVPVPTTIGPVEENRLEFVPSLSGADNPRIQAINGELNRTFRPLAIGDSANVEAEMVFAGYGITAPEYGYDDYAKIDVRGRVVVLVRKEPTVPPGDTRFEGNKNSRHAYFETKIKNASAHGAAGVLMVNDSDSIRAASARMDQRIADETNRLSRLDRQLSELPESAANSRATLSQRRDSAASMLEDMSRQRAILSEGLIEVGEAGEKPIVEGLPIVSLSRQLADQLLRAAGFESVGATCERIDRTVRPSSTSLVHRVKLKTRLTSSVVQSSNVIGVLDGRGPLSEETVIIGAHYDHVGMGGYASLAPGTFAVHNGADDNASGTATMLSSASRVRDSLKDVQSHRRVVFIAFTAEEHGLIGSEYYVRHPRFPLETTAAMINLDMVGRLRDNDLTVYGTGTGRELESIVDKANEATAFKLFKVASGYGPSDHQSFYAEKIPVLFFFTGLHNDYHRPSDDFDKINFNGLTRITDITSGVAVALAMRPDRPQYAATDRDVSIRWQATAYLGIQLREMNDGNGIMVASLTSGGAAEKAGIRVGDRLRKFDDTSIHTVGEALEWIGSRQADDALRIELQRGAETLSVIAVLQSRVGR